jgi:transposase-like protein
MMSQPLATDRPDPHATLRARASARYNHSIKKRAIAEVDERRLRNPRDRTIYREVARQFSVGEQSLRLWVKKKDSERLDENASANPVPTVGEVRSGEDMASELQLLRREIQRLRTENDVLKRAFVVFSSEWAGDK